jgi:hypothetical protein
MSLGLATHSESIDAQKQTVIRQIRCEFETDGSIKFMGTVCDRYTVEGKTVDANYRTATATYPSEAAMASMAAGNWAPTEEQLGAMAAAMGSAEGAVTVILSGFVGISQKAIDSLLTRPEGISS